MTFPKIKCSFCFIKSQKVLRNPNTWSVVQFPSQLEMREGEDMVRIVVVEEEVEC